MENKINHKRRRKSEPDMTERIVRFHTFIKFLSKTLNFLKHVRWDFESILLIF